MAGDYANPPLSQERFSLPCELSLKRNNFSPFSARRFIHIILPGLKGVKLHLARVVIVYYSCFNFFCREIMNYAESFWIF